ncbi:cysteine desulfurase family protein [Streptococcus hillyeri]|uniref:cysteine desulfurase n=1 Tax=Streptococcus hillyeri TaxID=2282420 RepID=A0A3L9E028_9STRE|nr:cysteine desulfurase family protein [Streptococcus hillyeri]RLY04752.1 cysteine desulfurase [Streptococcus hillyeri]
MIYFDNAATTPLTPSVISAMTEIMETTFGNPSSLHTFGRQANQQLRAFRSAIAQSLKTIDRHIIFTSGGTESNNTAIIGYALANQDKGKHLITTAVEHHSVLHAMTYLENRFGFEITYLSPVDGNISAKQVQEALRPDTILVSIMHANNETGTIHPISEIGQVLADHQAVFHVDAVQTVGKIEVLPEEWHVDFLSASAHKFHGPKGVGLLFAKEHYFDKLLHGGDQEEKRRASTENMISLAGMATALSESINHVEENYQHISDVRQAFLNELSGLDYYINAGSETLPHVLNIGFPNGNNGLLLTLLDLASFAVSTGSACTAGAVTPSHVLTSYYGPESPKLRESIRISFGEQNTVEEAQLLAQKLKELLT